MAQYGIAGQSSGNGQLQANVHSQGVFGRSTNAAFSNMMTISCTPHFKEDAQQHWVTQENMFGISYWFNPNEAPTLEDMIGAVENFISANYNKMMPQNMNVAAGGTQVQMHTTSNMQGKIVVVTIRGRNYERETLVNYKAGEYLHDGEVFNMDYAYQLTMNTTTNVKPFCCTLL